MSHRILTLGHCAVHGPDGDLAFPLGKPFALLVYLAVAEGPHPRSDLARLFWPGTDRTRARQSLRQALTALRQVLGAEVLEGDDPVAANAARIRTDVADLGLAIDREAPEDVLDLRQGGFLETFRLDDAPEFERWADDVRADLDRRTVRFLVEAAGREVVRGAAGEAARLADGAVSISPYDQRAHHALVEALMTLGDRGRAEAALERVEGLTEDLMDPAALAKLRRRLEALPLVRSDGAEDEPVLELVGRDRELSVLHRRWERARAGGTELVVITGPFGSGKTRLMEYTAAMVLAAGGSVAMARLPREDDAGPYATVVELVRALRRLPGSAGTTPATERTLLDLDRSGQAKHLADALVDLIGAVAFEGPLLLGVDDLDEVDPASAAVLRRVARQIAAEPVLLLLSSAEAYPADPRLDLPSLVRETRGTHLALHPLSDADVAGSLRVTGLVDTAEAAARVAARLAPSVAGIPLLLTDLVRDLRSRRIITVAEGSERLDEARLSEYQGSVPILAELIRRRTRGLSAVAARVAGVLAARNNGPVAVRDLERLSGLGPAAVATGLDELLGRDLVRWTERDRVVFAHHAFRDAGEAVAGRAEASFRRRRRGWIAAAAITAALAVGLLAQGAGFLPIGEGPPYGGGAIWLQRNGQWYTIPVEGQPGDWTATSAPDSISPEAVTGPFRITDGTVRWYGRLVYPDRGPDLTAIHGRDSTTLLISSSGDVEMGGVSPDGSRIVYVLEDTTWFPAHRQLLMIAAADGSNPRRLYTARYKIGAPVWAPDGQTIAFRTYGNPDTLHVVTPAGAPYARLVREDFGAIDWCGSRVAFQGQIGDEFRLGLWEPGDTVVEEFPGTAFGTLACAPDGRAVVHGSIEDGRPMLVLRDLESGEIIPLHDVPRDGIRLLRWVPDIINPVPKGLRLGEDSVALRWGERLSVLPRMVLSDGSERPLDRLVWSSSAPHIASVQDRNLLTGNSPGRAVITARYGPYLVDSMSVVVRGSEPRNTALHDPFSTLVTLRWIPVGDPLPVIDSTTFDAPVLHLRGDTKYEDGLVLREPLDATRGLTVEFEARLPLTADDYQDIQVCLQEARQPYALDRATGTWTSRQPRACVVVPAFKGPTFDPAAIALHVTDGPSPVHTLEEPFGTRWFHVAVQIRPDGATSLFIDHSMVLQSPVRLDPASMPFWTVQISARAVGTTAHLRNLSIWSEPRFLPPR